MRTQKQHIEYARDTAEKFNRIYSETFVLPKEYIMPEVATVPGVDGQKMSKSYGNTIPLFSSRDEITKAVMSIVTDSGSDRPENVHAIHKLIRSEADLAPLYDEYKGKYKALKDALIEDLDAYIAPMREKYLALSDETELTRILEKGAASARVHARAKMAIVRKSIGTA